MMKHNRKGVVVDITGQQQMLAREINPSFNTTFLAHEVRSRRSSDASVNVLTEQQPA